MEDMGLMDPKENKIYINSKQKPSQMESTLIHEIIEALDTLMELNLTHTQICSIESGFHQILKDNKNLFK